YVGAFQVLDFDAEKQFVNADINRLKQLATNTKGQTYATSQVDNLMRYLENAENYKAIQKAVTTRSPLIDWIWGLILLAILLAIEWFTRKYNGLL
ncbi:MAG TPA: hypothetical protein VJL37_00155, partial [Flavobacterium sp.]|nr:hypothetical protein [Flavobacterium sp.]